MNQTEVDRLYDAFAALIDGTAPELRERVLARLTIALAEQVDDYEKVLKAIAQSGKSGSEPDFPKR